MAYSKKSKIIQKNLLAEINEKERLSRIKNKTFTKEDIDYVTLDEFYIHMQNCLKNYFRIYVKCNKYSSEFWLVSENRFGEINIDEKVFSKKTENKMYYRLRLLYKYYNLKLFNEQ